MGASGLGLLVSITVPDSWRDELDGLSGGVGGAASHANVVVFGGDTALTHTFRQVGGAHLAIMPVGAYNPWIRVHCNPEQAWQMANDARADVVLPVHHQTFHLSQESSNEPLERILTAAGSSCDSRIPARVIGAELRLV